MLGRDSRRIPWNEETSVDLRELSLGNLVFYRPSKLEIGIRRYYTLEKGRGSLQHVLAKENLHNNAQYTFRTEYPQ